MHLIVLFLPQIISENAAQTRVSQSRLSEGTVLGLVLRRGMDRMGTMGQPIHLGREKCFGGEKGKRLQRWRKGKLWAPVKWDADVQCTSERAMLKTRKLLKLQGAWRNIFNLKKQI